MSEELNFPAIHQTIDHQNNTIFYFEGRALHQWLEVKSNYRDWARRRLQQHWHSLKENVDYVTALNRARLDAIGLPEKNHYFTLRAALQY